MIDTAAKIFTKFFFEISECLSEDLCVQQISSGILRNESLEHCGIPKKLASNS